ncbi:MAG: phosphoribosylglycinamide formyltransferase [Pseudomonadota bacterium]|nr:phosphoribosylglycinamide formyltransferase [Pseudomonadota bacterium]
MNDPCNIVVLISGGGSNLQAIIDAIDHRLIRARITAVISNERDAFGLTRATNAGIHTEVVDHRQFPDREAFDRQLIARIHSFAPDVVVLAGFMRILTHLVVDPLADRLLNIHPSLLPKYRGLHTHRRALETGDPQHGCSVHFATMELDGGPVILQASVPIHSGDDETSLAARVLEKEHVVYPLAVSWFCDGRLELREGRVWMDGAMLDAPLRLENLDDAEPARFQSSSAPE